MELSNEIWQTEVNGQVYETNFDELTQWIADGTLLPQDRVRRGNLRWIEANKVPSLHGFFNARDLNAGNPTVVSTTNQPGFQPVQTQTFNVSTPTTFAPQQPLNEPPPPQFYQELNEQTPTNFCIIHTDAKAKYHCETCTNYFCKACPQQKSCPMCGAVCTELAVPVVQPVPTFQPAFQPIIDDSVISDEVKKAGNWFYWKAGVTVLNSIIGLTGSMWAFFLGMTLPQLISGFVIGFKEGAEMQPGIDALSIVAFVLSLGCAGFMFFLGAKAKNGQKWALIFGLVIFALDGLLYLLSIAVDFSLPTILGVGIHLLAISFIAKAMKTLKK